METQKQDTYIAPSCEVYKLELESAVLGASNEPQKASVYHEGFTSGESLNWDDWTQEK